MSAAARAPLDSRAAGLMVFLCSLWGFTHVATKLAAPDISVVMQSAIRSGMSTVLLWAWARWRRIPLFDRDGTLGVGLVAGLLFAGEFLFIFEGLRHTDASRMVVFVYLSPVLTALGVHRFVPGEQLKSGQWAGVALAFCGLLAAFGEGFLRGRGSLLGDGFGVLAALLWAATTVWIRATRLSHTGAEKTLFYQVAVSAVVLAAASPLMGEAGVVRLTWLAIACMLFHGVVVAFGSYLAWFWLLTRFRAGNLSVFTFLTPLFGVVFGVLVLGERISLAFGGAVLLVGCGILLVNRR